MVTQKNKKKVIGCINSDAKVKESFFVPAAPYPFTLPSSKEKNAVFHQSMCVDVDTKRCVEVVFFSRMDFFFYRFRFKSSSFPICYFFRM